MRFVKYSTLMVVFVLTCGLTCRAQSSRVVLQTKPPHGIGPKNNAAGPAGQSTPLTGTTPNANAGTGAAPNTTPPDNGIQYHGGPVMNKTKGTNVYFIWYGNWSGDSAKLILPYLADHIGGSPYFNINTTYYEVDEEGKDKAPEKEPVLNKVNFEGSVDDNYSLGTSLSDLDIFHVVANALGVTLPPFDDDGVYFVLTSPDVAQQESAGIGGPFCAWHWDATNAGLPGQDIKVAWVGNPKTFFNFCGVQTAPSPNNNPDADSMASFVAHELEESVTDPIFNAWYDVNGNENGDLCAWTFGNYKSLPDGAFFNMKLGNRPYLIQRNWVNAKGGYCALKWDE
jgi:hypothetical protein